LSQRRRTAESLRSASQAQSLLPRRDAQKVNVKGCETVKYECANMTSLEMSKSLTGE
jgi:hypothetical protein